MMRWKKMIDAPLDGRGFLAYGAHADPVPAGVARNVQPGDHWFAILLFDVWRKPFSFVFAKDGTPAWSEPLAWAELEAPDMEALL